MELIVFAEAPNALRIVREQPPRCEMQRFRRARNHQALYTAAAQLWKDGVDMSRAIQIVSDAVAASSA